jgi:adenylosuccinate lyase
MKFEALEALSPIDGRYREKVEALVPYFSEKALIQYRVEVEVRYFQALHALGLPPLQGISEDQAATLTDLYSSFSHEDALAIKEIEKTTNHDVKAVEYFIKTALEKRGLADFQEFIHFGLTSQDINNTAIPLMLKRATEEVLMPALHAFVDALTKLAAAWKDIAMLARTHGQPASPTRLGKEMEVYVQRLRAQIKELERLPYAAKFGGATGNFNAHHVAYPDQDWHAFAHDFVQSLGLQRSHPTTQIEHYDYLAAYFDAFKRINTILLDLSRDFWQYISMNYFKQRIKKGEVGSSAMPHKVNPIDFENAEGNLGIANAFFEHLSAKLPISRLQRDLTDSTVLRNMGVPLAHSLLSFHSLVKGLSKVEVNEEAIVDDLAANWAVVAEAIQTILRREGYPKPYEALKELTRTQTRITEAGIREFVSTLEVSEEIKQEILQISPFNYTGM